MMLAPDIDSISDKIINNGLGEWTRHARELLVKAFHAGLNAVDPWTIVKRKLKLEKEKLQFTRQNDTIEVDLSKTRKIVVIGAGKATGSMAMAIQDTLGDMVHEGSINIPEPLAKSVKDSLDRIQVVGAGHPIPSRNGIMGCEQMISLTSNLTPDDLVITLISGGGSALMACPATGISLDDLQVMNQLLIECGASIQEINTVRKHVSSIKGGHLANLLSPARVITLILSDVVGDDLSTIASGPTVPDPTTFSDALEVIRRYNISNRVPPAILRRLSLGNDGKVPETPKPGNSCFESITNIIIGSARDAARDIKDFIHREYLQCSSFVLSTTIEGIASEFGAELNKITESIEKGAKNYTFQGNRTNLHGKQLSISYDARVASESLLIFAGETTVEIQGNGTGGRNQEILLSFLVSGGLSIDHACLSCGMDGLEGNSPAAGALIDGDTPAKSMERGMNPAKYLENNDSYTFFKELGDAIITGPTGTNVNDLTLLLVRKGVSTVQVESR